jgi:glycosyltransferase involved in cell wall biosynthesis
VKRILKATGRALKYGVLKWAANRRINRLDVDDSSLAPMPSAYLVGCGRSGTTISGDILKRHPQARYFFEPYHLWATIDPTIDVLNLYHLGAASFLLDADRVTPEARRRFNRLLLDPARERGASIMIEKTPCNACRIGYLDALSPGCKVIHLVRDGVDVARSIDRLSRDRSYRIVGKPDLNRWWGRGGSKWAALSQDGSEAGYFAEEIEKLRSYESMGAYEWLVSIAEIDRWRDRLGDRLLEITYDEFTSHPRESLRQICEFLSLTTEEKWLKEEAKRIDKARRNYGVPVVLPERMAAAFNRVQERYHFPNRAVAGMPEAVAPVRMAIISNEPTPYRLHVLERLAEEVEGVDIHNIFTHTISNPSMPWQMRISARLNPIFFPKNHITVGRPISIRHVRLFRDIRDHVQKHGIQMVILLGYNDLTRLMFMRWAHQLGLPVLLAADSNVFGDAKTQWWLRALKRRYVRWVLRRLAGLMPMGTCGRAFFRSYMDHRLPEFLFPYEPDYESLRNIDPKRVDEFRKKHGLDPARKRLLYCGRLVNVKRVDVLLEAFSRVALARPDWDVVIAGDGPLREDLQKLLTHITQPRVKWLGFLQFDEVVLAYHACDVLVHPSDYEPWALVINEAVACELPVIATSVVGAGVELVRHRENGLIVAPRSVESMTNAIWEMTRTDRYLEMKAGCAMVLESWKRAADPVEGVREALQHFGLVWRQAVEPGGHREQKRSADVAFERPIMGSGKRAGDQASGART